MKVNMKMDYVMDMELIFIQMEKKVMKDFIKMGWNLNLVFVI
jgi:hypothetical protein